MGSEDSFRPRIGVDWVVTAERQIIGFVAVTHVSQPVWHVCFNHVRGNKRGDLVNDTPQTMY